MAEAIEKEDGQEATKKSLTTLIASMLTRYRTQKDPKIKEILMLLAALQVLNQPDADNHYTVATARRLISGAK